MTKDMNASGDRASGSEAGFDDFLAEAYRLVFVAIRSTVFQERDVTIDQWVVLRILRDGSPCPIGSIGRRTGLSGAQVRQVLAELKRKQLVKVVEPEGGARRRAVSIESKGLALADFVSSELRTLANARLPAKRRQLENAAGAAEAMQKRYARATSLSRRVSRAFSTRAGRAAEGTIRAAKS